MQSERVRRAGGLAIRTKFSYITYVLYEACVNRIEAVLRFLELGLKQSFFFFARKIMLPPDVRRAGASFGNNPIFAAVAQLFDRSKPLMLVQISSRCLLRSRFSR